MLSSTEIANRFFVADYQPLSHVYLSENQLEEIAKILLNKSSIDFTVEAILSEIPNNNRCFDWNAGSILRHFPVDTVVRALGSTGWEKLYNSIGITWVLGEYRNKHRTIIDYLRGTVNYANNSDAWWRAAFSLEQLDQGEAINILKMSLKYQNLGNLSDYLNTLDDKKSVIGVLVLSNVDNLENIIYPTVKRRLFETKNISELLNCCWLIGRLRFIDKDIIDYLVKLTKSKNYEIKYYTFFALQNNATGLLRPVMENAIKDKDPLIRKMAIRGLLAIGNDTSLEILQKRLTKETDESTIGELTQAIYSIRNPSTRSLLLIKNRSARNENGMISDESDKWYSDPSIYQQFADAEDPDNICLNLIINRIGDKLIKNPIDLATGTGRIVWPLMDNIRFEGSFFAVDASDKMCDYIKKASKRERKYTHNLSVVKSKIIDTPKYIKIKSNFIISSFGFPSKISQPKQCFAELKAVYELLTDDGLFFTLGWDETFNDDLNIMWHRFIPDNILASDFEDWRQQRSKKIGSPRNCGLTWYKKGLRVPLQFSTLKESANVMGYLFGRDAAQCIIKNNLTEWMMSLGITCDTKESIKKILENNQL